MSGKDHLKCRIHDSVRGYFVIRRGHVPEKTGKDLSIRQTRQGSRIKGKGISRFPIRHLRIPFHDQNRFPTFPDGGKGGNQ